MHIVIFKQLGSKTGFIDFVVCSLIWKSTAENSVDVEFATMCTKQRKKIASASVKIGPLIEFQELIDQSLVDSLVMLSPHVLLRCAQSPHLRLIL